MLKFVLYVRGTGQANTKNVYIKYQEKFGPFTDLGFVDWELHYYSNISETALLENRSQTTR